MKKGRPRAIFLVVRRPTRNPGYGSAAINHGNVYYGYADKKYEKLESKKTKGVLIAGQRPRAELKWPFRRGEGPGGHRGGNRDPAVGRT